MMEASMPTVDPTNSLTRRGTGSLNADVLSAESATVALLF